MQTFQMYLLGIIFFVFVIPLSANDSYGLCPNCATEPSCQIKNKDSIITSYEKLELECIVPVYQKNAVATISIYDSNVKNPYFVEKITPDLTGFFDFGYTVCDKNKMSGKQNISVNYLGSVGNFPFNFVQQYDKSTPKNIKCGLSINNNIPDWLRNNASWWSEKQIDDITFLQGIQYLINKQIIKISATNENSGFSSNDIPNWLRNNANSWAKGLITDNEFLKGIQFLIEKGIIQV
ncbi:MAG: hypothetical protein OES14_04765 [Nitrosopumilus sp.]|nr:hypothetical protein [Nitrosopumilus sp.]